MASTTASDDYEEGAVVSDSEPVDEPLEMGDERSEEVVVSMDDVENTTVVTTCLSTKAAAQAAANKKDSDDDDDGVFLVTPTSSYDRRLAHVLSAVALRSSGSETNKSPQKKDHSPKAQATKCPKVPPPPPTTTTAKSNHDDDKAAAKLTAKMPRYLEFSIPTHVTDSGRPSTTSSSSGAMIASRDNNPSHHDDDDDDEPIFMMDGSDIMPLPENNDISYNDQSTINQVVAAEGVPGAHAIGGGLGRRPPAAFYQPPQQEDRNHHPATAVGGLVLEDAVILVSTSSNASEEENGGQADEEDPEEVIDGVILHPRPPPRNERTSRKTRLCVLGTISTLLVVGCVLFLVFWIRRPSDECTTHNNNRDASVLAPAASGEIIIHPPYREDGLPASFLDWISDPTSYTYKSNLWMLNDPNLDTYSESRQWQRFNLAYFYYITHGDNWTRNDHWLDYRVSECDWYSSAPPQGDQQPICDPDTNEFLVLNLTNNNLQGTFGNSNSFIPSVVVVDISYNDLYGRVPTYVSSPGLEELVVSHNRFEGQLVGDGVFAAFKLRVIKIDGNNLVGSSASYVYRFLPHLEVLNITGNRFFGEFNTELRWCPNMTYVGFGHNDIYGSIPSELGLLSRLQEVDVAGNPRMEGTIPDELGHLPNLRKLDVSGTAIEGQIPEPLCQRILDDEEDDNDGGGSFELVANGSLVESCQKTGLINATGSLLMHNRSTHS